MESCKYSWISMLYFASFDAKLRGGILYGRRETHENSNLRPIMEEKNTFCGHADAPLRAGLLTIFGLVILLLLLLLLLPPGGVCEAHPAPAGASHMAWPGACRFGASRAVCVGSVVKKGHAFWAARLGSGTWHCPWSGASFG